jgi:aspartyl-tRNA synthetase
MISGFDKYFQIARCFRDEDLRADRQLEFTQVDLEMSFPHQETVFAVAEQFLSAGFAAAGVTLSTPFPRITYDDSMRHYGSDKPDLRLPGLTDVRPAFTDANLATLQIDPALPVVALRIPKVGELSRKERQVHRRLQAAGQGISRGRRQGARVGRRGGGRLRHHRGRRPGPSGQGQRHQV